MDMRVDYLIDPKYKIGLSQLVESSTIRRQKQARFEFKVLLVACVVGFTGAGLAIATRTGLVFLAVMLLFAGLLYWAASKWMPNFQASLPSGVEESDTVKFDTLIANVTEYKMLAAPAMKEDTPGPYYQELWEFAKAVEASMRAHKSSLLF